MTMDVIVAIICFIALWWLFSSTHKWVYTDSTHRVCKRCGQKQLLYKSIMLGSNESVWVQESDGFKTSYCPSVKEQKEMQKIIEKYRSK